MTDQPPPPVDTAAPIDVVELRRRQKARAKVMGLCLFGLVILFYLITIAKTVGP
jgi:accessory gene regulator protein AgrB